MNVASKNSSAVMYMKQDGTCTWDWRDWKGFLSPHFRACKGIRDYQQFRFTAASPGVVFAKKCDGGEEVAVNLYTGGNGVVRGKPPVIPPAGLTLDRRRYLGQHIRQYVRDINKDRICPIPEE